MLENELVESTLPINCNVITLAEDELNAISAMANVLRDNDATVEVSLKENNKKNEKSKNKNKNNDNIKNNTKSIVTQLALKDIVVEKGLNPRQNYDSEALQRLATSLKHVGMIQPIVVRTKENDNKYYIVTGERRYRAAKLIKMSTVPVVVRENMTTSQVIFAQHAENVHRENLNTIEYAQSIKNFIGQKIEMVINKQKTIVTVNAKIAAEVYNLTQGAVSQYLSILELPSHIQDAVRDGKMSFAQARELCSSKLSSDSNLREEVFKKIMAGETVRASDIRDLGEKKHAQKVVKSDVNDETKKRGRPSKVNVDLPNVRQDLNTALSCLRSSKISTRKPAEIRESLAISYERHEHAKSDEKKNFYKGFISALEWVARFKDSF